MSVEDEGFLSNDLVEPIRKAFPEHFDLAQRVSRCGQLQLRHFPPKLEVFHLLAVPLYMRGLSNLQATVILNERGMAQEALTVTRGVFEAVFYLGAARIDPEGVIDSAKSDDINQRAKQAKAVLALKVDPISPGVDKTLNDFLAYAKESPRHSGLNVEEASKKAGLHELYSTYYRGLSNSAVHPSLTALQRHLIESDDTHGLEFGWGPASRDELRLSLITSILAGVTLCLEGAEVFDSDEVRGQVSSCWEDYQRLAYRRS